MSNTDPARPADLLPADQRVQPDSPLSGEVQRGGNRDTPQPSPSRRYQRHLAGTSTRKPPTARGSPTTPSVYFVRAKTMGLIKIGVTIDINERLKTLQVGSPDQLELVGAISSPFAHKLEIDLHIRFQEARSHGEWFKPVGDLLVVIERHSLERHAQSTKDELRAALKLNYRPA